MAANKLEGSAEALYVLKTYEKDLYTELGKNLNTQLRPVLGPIQGQINGVITSQLRSRRKAGMFGHDGRTQWAGAEIKTKTSIKPKDLIFIEGKGRGTGSLDGALGFEYAELAGIRKNAPKVMSKGWGITGTGYHSYTQNGQGDGFINMLNKYGGPGRFLFRRVLKKRPDIEDKVLLLSEKLNIKINRKLATETGSSGMKVN
tara:strand:+ start:90 stop:695 length:606 start_codon:yes stop_codon:yes gene_type:complete